MTPRPPDTTPLRLAIRIRGQPVQISVDVPNRPVRLDQLLPALRAMDDQIIGAVVADTEAKGARVACAKGCSACCRVQPVPVTPPEAYALALLVERLPEPRRTRVKAAFAEVTARLREAGLDQLYLQRDAAMTRDQALAAVYRYMGLRLPCPFLEDDVCSIHPERPFVCRQYLVTSPPPLCDAPLDNQVKPIPMAAAFAGAMLEAGESLSGAPQYSVPLTLALEKARLERAELERLHQPQPVFEQIVRTALK